LLPTRLKANSDDLVKKKGSPLTGRGFPVRKSSFFDTPLSPACKAELRDALPVMEVVIMGIDNSEILL
jgi:hypothetical protein